MIIHLIDGTYELFRHYYGLKRFSPKGKPFGAGTIDVVVVVGPAALGGGDDDFADDEQAVIRSVAAAAVVTSLGVRIGESYARNASSARHRRVDARVG